MRLSVEISRWFLHLRSVFHSCDSLFALRTSQGRFSSSRRATVPGAFDECPSALLSYLFLIRRRAVATHMCRRWTAKVGERCRYCDRPIPMTCRVAIDGKHADRSQSVDCPPAAGKLRSSTGSVTGGTPSLIPLSASMTMSSVRRRRLKCASR